MPSKTLSHEVHLSASCLFTLQHSAALLQATGRAGKVHAAKQVLCLCCCCLGSLWGRACRAGGSGLELLGGFSIEVRAQQRYRGTCSRSGSAVSTQDAASGVLHLPARHRLPSSGSKYHQ